MVGEKPITKVGQPMLDIGNLERGMDMESSKSFTKEDHTRNCIRVKYIDRVWLKYLIIRNLSK